LVYITAALDCYMVSQELEGQHRKKRVKGVGYGRYVEDFVGEGGEAVIAFGGDSDDVTFTGFDFLEVAEDFFVGAVLDGDDEDGHIFVDEGDGAMFHFAGGVAFGVDVGDFFEFEGAFEGDGVVVAASEEEAMIFMGEFWGEGLDLGVEGFEGGFYEGGDFEEGMDEGVVEVAVYLVTGGA
jgi:hypothetical protein